MEQAKNSETKRRKEYGGGVKKEEGKTEGEREMEGLMKRRQGKEIWLKGGMTKGS
jgi:hypothetical protein